MALGTYGQSPIVSQQFTAQSADETLGPWVDVRGCQNVAFYLVGTGTTSSGVISFEEAAPLDVTVVPWTVYGAATGNYSLIATQNASDVSAGVQLGVHLASRAYFYVRARISTIIGGGGTVTCNLVAY